MPATAALKIWLFLSAAALAIHLGGPPLLDPDEGRNAEVAREMAETNDYVVPRLNGMPYLDKPIVYFAAEAFFMEILGPTELAARLPAYLFTLGTAAMVFWFARKRIGENEAYVASAAFLAMPLTIAFARIVIFDSALNFFIVGAIIAFHEAIEEGSRKWTTIAWVAIAFGVLTKGPVAIAVPLLIAIPYAIRRKTLRRLGSILGFVLFAAIIAPWVWAVSREVPDFLHYVLVTETAARMATDELRRTGPPWYFLPYLVGGAAPWSIVAIASWRALRRRDPMLLFLLLWIIVPLVFFSISQSKRPQYILPLMPGVALLIGWIWREIRFRAAALIASVFGVVLLVAASMPQLIARMRPEIAPAARNAALVLGAVLLIGGLVAAFARQREIGFVALSLPVIALPLVANPLMHALGERRSARSLVAEIAPQFTPQT
ncbi:MAG TPA: glycosyltransferase family 39 protein, partial [Thermoanaerobaculia bacterium]